ncbi:MAG: hypothetical protein ACK4V6_14695 [Microthrixaceae bacterium]
MKLYADTAGRRTRQIVTDLLFVIWVLSWIALGNSVHDGTAALADPGHRIDRSATSLGDSMTEAGDVLSGIPLVGNEAATPFDKASEASESLAAAGRAQVASVERLAFWLGLSIAGIPILMVAAFHVPRRVRFIRESTAGQRFIDSEADEELFAWRAMANQPLPKLVRISDDPVGAVRRGERDTIRQLAALEMRDVGLVPRS